MFKSKNTEFRALHYRLLQYITKKSQMSTFYILKIFPGGKSASITLPNTVQNDAAEESYSVLAIARKRCQAILAADSAGANDIIPLNLL